MTFICAVQYTCSHGVRSSGPDSLSHLPIRSAVHLMNYAQPCLALSSAETANASMTRLESHSLTPIYPHLNRSAVLPTMSHRRHLSCLCGHRASRTQSPTPQPRPTSTANPPVVSTPAPSPAAQTTRPVGNMRRAGTENSNTTMQMIAGGDAAQRKYAKWQTSSVRRAGMRLGQYCPPLKYAMRSILEIESSLDYSTLHGL